MAFRPTRRTLLRGMGAALALPWLESLCPPFAGPRQRPPRGRRSGWASGMCPTACICRPGSRGTRERSSTCPKRSVRSRWPRLPELLSRSDAQHRAHQRRHRRVRPWPGCRQLPHRRPGLQDARRRARRHLRRPALCAPRRRRDPLSQPRARLRVGPLGQRVRLQRDLQDAYLLAHADLARPL